MSGWLHLYAPVHVGDLMHKLSHMVLQCIILCCHGSGTHTQPCCLPCCCLQYITLSLTAVHIVTVTSTMPAAVAFKCDAKQCRCASYTDTCPVSSYLVSSWTRAVADISLLRKHGLFPYKPVLLLCKQLLELVTSCSSSSHCRCVMLSSVACIRSGIS